MSRASSALVETRAVAMFWKIGRSAWTRSLASPLGACSLAPALMMNYEFHENLTPAKIDELIDGLKKKEEQ